MHRLHLVFLVTTALLATTSTSWGAPVATSPPPSPSVAVATPSKKAFADVPDRHWALAATNYAEHRGVMQVDERGQFNGDAPLTRYQFAVAFARLVSLQGTLLLAPPPEPVAKPSSNSALSPNPNTNQNSQTPQRRWFTDVPRDHWAATAVESLAQNGLLEGDAQGRFNGDQPMTRDAFAVAVARFMDGHVCLLPLPSSTKPQ